MESFERDRTRRQELLVTAWEGAPRNRDGVVIFNVPELQGPIDAVLDAVAAPADDATLLDDVNERFSDLARRAGLEVTPKIDAHGFNASNGTKTSVQAGVMTMSHLRAWSPNWPDGILPTFDAIETLRITMSEVLAERLATPALTESRQSVRAMEYEPGIHLPQRPHTDRPVVAMIVVPPHDDCLWLKDVSFNRKWKRLLAGDTALAVVLPGESASALVPNMRAVKHAVGRLRTIRRRVATLFVG